MANILYYLLPCAVFLVVVAYHGSDLPPGPYCGITGECCQDRKDSCAHMILDTLCYCDQHCNRTHDDCCPDYEEVCLGLKTTPAPDNYTLPDICREGQKKMERCYPCTCRRNQYGELDWECQPEACIMDDYIVNEINRGGFSWRAANYSEFYGKTLKDGLVYKLGTLPLSPETRRMGPIRYNKDINYPTTFDARVRWPGFISPVIEQGWCGSDWAIAIAGVASDRLAIQSNGAETVVLSPQTLLSCNIQDQKGCEGGYIDNAWNFVRGHGLVDEPCLPYQASVTPCPFKRRGNLLDDGCNPLQKRTSRYKVGPPGLLREVEDIMYDIMDSGPVHAIMTVHQDFFHYREGVYRRSPFGIQNYEGLHSVRIVGWGEDRGDKYWIVANSWGRQWGEDGYFRIARGSSESGIESFVVTVLSEVSEA